MSKVINVSNARDNLDKLIDETVQNHKPILIKGKRNSAILLSEEDFKVIEETLYLLSIPGMRESIKEGLNIPIGECKENID